MYIESEDKKYLQSKARSAGVSLAEVVRRCIHAYKKQPNNKHEIKHTEEEEEEEPDYGED